MLSLVIRGPPVDLFQCMRHGTNPMAAELSCRIGRRTAAHRIGLFARRRHFADSGTAASVFGDIATRASALL